MSIAKSYHGISVNVFGCGVLILGEAGNVLASLGKAKFTMVLNLFIVIVNILVTYWLVKLYGVIGASCGVVIIYLLSSIFAVVALRQIFAP